MQAPIDPPRTPAWDAHRDRETDITIELNRRLGLALNPSPGVSVSLDDIGYLHGRDVCTATLELGEVTLICPRQLVESADCMADELGGALADRLELIARALREQITKQQALVASGCHSQLARS